MQVIKKINKKNLQTGTCLFNAALIKHLRMPRPEHLTVSETNKHIFTILSSVEMYKRGKSIDITLNEYESSSLCSL